MLRNRYRRITFFFARILAGIIICDIILPRLGFRTWSTRTRPARLKSIAAHFRSLAIQMGGVMIKVGQFMSTRVDVLPVEITAELSGLQDEVPAEKFSVIQQVAGKEFGIPLLEKFLYVDPEPLAAASLGQVHRARLAVDELGWIPQDSCGNEDTDQRQIGVVVKIQRPDIEKIVNTDLAALRTIGRWLNRYPPIRKRADVPALLREFSQTLFEEIDYLAEGHNAETFAANFKQIPSVRVPRVVWSHTTKHVLTLEDVWAIKITDYGAIDAAGIDRAEVASRLLDTYLKQIFEDGFFHADPHPGNLFITPCLPAGGRHRLSWRLTFVDFGMVGHVSKNVLDALREMMVAVGTQDAHRLVKASQMLGVLLPSADLDLLERAEAAMFERFWGKDMAELRNTDPEELIDFAREFRDLIYDLPFQIPSDLIFLGRAVGILSGMCTGLDPSFNVWEHLAPFAQKLVAAELSRGGMFWLNELGEILRRSINLPQRLNSMLIKMERGDLIVRQPELVNQVRHLEAAVSQVAVSVVFAALILSAVQLYLADEFILSAVLGAGAGASLLWLVFHRLR